MFKTPIYLRGHLVDNYDGYITDAKYIKDGYQVVDTIRDRDLLPTKFPVNITVGCRVHVRETIKDYRYSGNGKWTEIIEGGSGGGVPQEYVDRQDAAVWEKASEAISTEAEERKNSDAGLQKNIDAEAATRTSEDEKLQKNIDGEKLARENADNSIKADIEVLKDTSATKNELSNEAKARQDADTRIEGIANSKSKVEGTSAGDNWTEIEIDGVKKKIPQGGSGPTKFLATIAKDEAGVVTVTDQDGNPTTFQTGGGSGGGVTQEYVDKQDDATYNKSHAELEVVCKTLDTVAAQLEEEKSTRRTEDNYIKEDLITETNRAKAAEEQLQKNIDGEALARTNAVNAINAKIDVLEDTSATKNELSTEKSRAETKEAELDAAINEEVSRAKAAEEANTAAINAEATRAKAAENANAADIIEIKVNKVNVLKSSSTDYPTCDAVINYIASLDGDNDTF